MVFVDTLVLPTREPQFGHSAARSVPFDGLCVCVCVCEAYEITRQ